MPSPVYSAGTPGNLINDVSLAHGTTLAAYLDLSACIEGQVSCEIATGGTPPSAGTTFSAYRVKGNAIPITLSSGVTAGTASTSLPVSAKAGLHQGEYVALRQLSGAGLGEVVQITGAITGTGPYTVPITGTGSLGGTVNTYLSSDVVYLIEQTAIDVTMPASPSNSWAANGDYSDTIFLGTGQYVVAASNGDSSQSVTLMVTLDKITGLA